MNQDDRGQRGKNKHRNRTKDRQHHCQYNNHNNNNYNYDQYRNRYYQPFVPNNINNQYYYQQYQHNYNHHNSYKYYNYQHAEYQNYNHTYYDNSNYSMPHPVQTSKNTLIEEFKSDLFISKFDANQVLQKQPTTLETKMDLKHIIYYHTDPTNKLLQFNDKIKPISIKLENIKSLININLNEIPIDYSINSNNKQQTFVGGLYQQYPPKKYWNTTRIDPFCYEIQKIDKAIKKKDTKTGTRFITYRHNLRGIANVVLFKLMGLRMYDKCGINIGIHRNGNDIMLENIVEFDEKNDEKWFNINCAYGYLLEHTLESLSNINNNNNNNNNRCIPTMNYQTTCVNRNEIRSLNHLQIGDIQILAAAEMDAIMNDKCIELKSCKIQLNKRKNKNKSHLSDIADFKLLKYWTQCIFGGVDSVAVAVHEKGIIKKTKIITTKEIENMFPVITRKCIRMVYEILKWIQNIIMKLPENNLYLLSFDTNIQNNNQFIFKYLSSKQTEKKIFEMLSNIHDINQANKLLNHGLIINPQNKQLQMKKIL